MLYKMLNSPKVLCVDCKHCKRDWGRQSNGIGSPPQRCALLDKPVNPLRPACPKADTSW